MTTVTDKELIKEIKERIGSLDVRDNIERRAYEIALASLEAEPVAWQVTITKDGQDSASIIYRDCAEKDTWVRIHETLGSVVHVTPLYMAPPAPVTQADVAQAIENLRQKLVECNRYNYCADAVKGVEDACHATMLQGSQPVSQTYNLPELIEGMEVSIDVSTCDADLGNRYFGTVTEALELDTAKNGYILLVQDAEPNFDVNGNSPGTPDSWISCSERMPAQDDWILIYSKHGEYMAGQVQGEYVELSDGTLSWLGNVLFWMPLPEPPQEVNRG
ncbi:DUF551 domain-containing protein [Escherichia coli]|nr:DUF551 domain-containing protein [Escherichia coli]ELV8133436.1 DUF551 domain-containing protein [Escherichia coli]HBB6399026.1 DUF551 domain-containing protein [Escherichia coli]